MICRVCRGQLDPALAPEVTHPSCSADSMWLDTDGPDPFDAVAKQQFIDMFMWKENESPRSKQLDIGPSEMGHPCERHIAYRLTATPAVNLGFDPWPAVVGTAVHAWVEQAVNEYQKASRQEDFLTETTLDISGVATGHADLYWKSQKTVVDWKTAGPDVMKKVRANGPPDGYVVQAQIYGLGFEQAGWPVDRVALAFLPRAGWLRDMYVWSAPYARDIAEAALARVLAIGQKILDLNIFTNFHRFEQVPASPGDHCGFCPWFKSTLMAEQGASEKGCPAAT